MCYRFLINTTKIVLVLIFIISFYPKVSESHFCTESICRLCCKPTQNGCVNGFTQNYSLALSSVNLACQDCNCSNPEIGCGWQGRRFNRVQCESCNTLTSLCDLNPNLQVAGCGRSIISGALIYTS